MKVCIVGGIFDKSPEYRTKHAISPETVLAAGLADRGIDVATMGHRNFRRSSEWDIIHVHHFGRGALRAALQCSPRQFVLTPHDGLLLNGWPLPWRRRLSDPFVLSRAAAVVALSATEKQFLSSAFRLPARKIEVVPNGIPFSTFQTGEPAPGADPFLLHVGQLQSFKGIDYLFQAFARVRAEFPAVRLFLAHQTEECVDHYRGLAASLGIADGVTFGGAKSPEELSRLYRSAAVVVSSSLAECLSTVVLEAMASGAAVVATDVGGIREQLDPHTGRIVPPADAAALADAIAALLRNPQAARRLGSQAAQTVAERFSVKQMIDGHLNLYEGMKTREQHFCSN